MRNIISFVFALIVLLSGCSTTSHYNETRCTTVYDSVLMEVYSNNANPPNKTDFDGLIEQLDKYSICKKENIKIYFYNNIDMMGLVFWPMNIIKNLEKKSRITKDYNKSDSHLKVFIVYLPGIYGELNKHNNAGIQYGYDSIAIFGTKSDNSRESVLLHEFLHIMNLVNRKRRTGPPVNPKRPTHCNNDKCVMFWIVRKEIWLCPLCKSDINRLK